MTAVKQIKLLTVQEYLAVERTSPVKHEDTGGYVYATAGDENVHQKISGAFFGALYTRPRGRPCQPFNSDTMVCVRVPSRARLYYPDGMVICGPNPDDDDDDEFQSRPVVIAEVSSPSTRRIDESERRDAYLTIPTLSAYLLIETSHPRVVTHHRTPEGFVARVYEGMDAVVPLEAIGTDLPLSKLYERVDFTVAAAEWPAENAELVR